MNDKEKDFLKSIDSVPNNSVEEAVMSFAKIMNVFGDVSKTIANAFINIGNGLVATPINWQALKYLDADQQVKYIRMKLKRYEKYVRRYERNVKK